MRRIVVAAMSTLSALVLLLVYPTSSDRAAPAAVAALAHTVGSGSSGGSGAASGGATAGTDPQQPSGTFTGDTVSTQWGPVQVEITVAAGRITASDAIVYPNGNSRDAEINSYALPVLNGEVVTAQSARIDMVSGATVTSVGYVTSLQQAIDQAFGATP